MERTWKVTLADGTVFEGLGLNGNNFISISPVDEAVFTEDALKEVDAVDTKSGEAMHFEDAFLVQVAKYDGEYWFILAEKTQEEKDRETLVAKADRTSAVQEYNIMMGNLEDPSEEE